MSTVDLAALVRLVGVLLGEVIGELEGDGGFRLVERVRDVVSGSGLVRVRRANLAS